MTLLAEPPAPPPQLEARHDQIVARLTRRLADEARRQRRARNLPAHDFLVPVLRPDLLPPVTPPGT